METTTYAFADGPTPAPVVMADLPKASRPEAMVRSAWARQVRYWETSNQLDAMIEETEGKIRRKKELLAKSGWTFQFDMDTEKWE